jgi:hypothetical protein
MSLTSRKKDLALGVLFVTLSTILFTIPLDLHHIDGPTFDKSKDFDYLSIGGVMVFAIIFLFTVSLTPSELDIKLRAISFPFAYAAGFLYLTIYYCLGWWTLGHYQSGTSCVTAPFSDLPEAFYFSAITSTTTGYGDLTPCRDARLFAIQSLPFQYCY